MLLPFPERRYFMDGVQMQYYASVIKARQENQSGEGGGGTFTGGAVRNGRKEVKVQPSKPSNAVLARMPGGRVILADTPQGFAGGKYSPPPKPQAVSNPNKPFEALKQRGEALDEYYNNPVRKQAEQWAGADAFFRTHPNYGVTQSQGRKVIDTEATKEHLKAWFSKLPPWAKSAVRNIYNNIMSKKQITWSDWAEFKAEAQVFLTQGANAVSVTIPNAVIKDMGMVTESEVPEQHAYQYMGNLGSKYTDTGFHGLEEEWLLKRTMASDPLNQLGMKVSELEDWAAKQRNPIAGFVGGVATGLAAFGVGVLEGLTAPVRPSTWWGTYKLVSNPQETLGEMREEFVTHPVTFTGRFVGSMVGAKFLTDWVRLNLGTTVKKFTPEKTEYSVTHINDRTVMYEIRQLGRMKTVYRGPVAKGPKIAEGYQTGKGAGIVVKEYVTPATGEPVLRRFGGRIYVVKLGKVYDAVIRGNEKGIYFAAKKMGRDYSAFAQYELRPIKWSWGSWFRRVRIVVNVGDGDVVTGSVKGASTSGSASASTGNAVTSAEGVATQVLSNLMSDLPADVAPDVVVNAPSVGPGFGPPSPAVTALREREVRESKGKTQEVSDVSVDVEPVTRSAPTINSVNINGVEARGSRPRQREWASSIFSFEPVTRVRHAREVSATPWRGTHASSHSDITVTDFGDTPTVTDFDLRDEFTFDVPRVRGGPPTDITFPRVRPRPKEVVKPRPRSRLKPAMSELPDVDVRPDELLGVKVRQVTAPRLTLRSPPRRKPRSNSPKDFTVAPFEGVALPSAGPRCKPRRRRRKGKYEERVNPFGLPFSAELPNDLFGV